MQYICKPEKVRIYNNTAAKTAKQVKAETGCDAIINGGLFNMSTFKATGNLKADGVEISREWGAAQGYEWSGNDLPRFGWSDMKTAENFIGCVAMVENGVMLNMNYPPAMGGARPRTAFGMFADGRVWLYAINANTTPEALREAALAAGVDSAIMLDGGGSTQGIFPTETIFSPRVVQHFICVWADKEEPTMPEDKLNIIETAWVWASGMDTRKATNRIVLHHAAVKEASALAIHRAHIANKWSGIGYHYYIRKDGSIYRGRPENIKGVHAAGANDDSIGICFEGNFQTDVMSATQKNAGIALITDILNRYGDLEIIGHRDVNATACPGHNFPFGEFAALSSANPDIVPAPQPEPATNKINITLSLDMLRNGSVGKDVEFLQELLNGKGYPCGQADGIFGANTEKAVTDYQRDNGLTPDGIAGENTWRSLLIK